MKKIAATLVLALTLCSVNAQQYSEADGLWYANTNILYSGKLISFFPDGTKKSEYTVEQGKLNGEAIFYSQEGKILEMGFYSNGAKHGKWVRYNYSGKQLAIASYNNGDKHGKWIVWDDNGVKRFEMEYANGHKTGTWQEWNEQEELVSQRTY